ncbi:T9SS type A sorting domain-containing protein [Gabonia massiliensis]|nr:T9SS type A sorting domain-containing protein [Gabonia massiliensis]
MNITESNDKTSEIPLSDFNFFTFIEKVISSVEMPSKSNTIVYIDTNDILSIKTDNTIDNVEIFSVNGNKILSSIPVSSTFSHSLASYPAGMYIVKTRIGENQEFHKIIKK